MLLILYLHKDALQEITDRSSELRGRLKYLLLSYREPQKKGAEKHPIFTATDSLKNPITTDNMDKTRRLVPDIIELGHVLLLTGSLPLLFVFVTENLSLRFLLACLFSIECTLIIAQMTGFLRSTRLVLILHYSNFSSIFLVLSFLVLLADNDFYGVSALFGPYLVLSLLGSVILMLSTYKPYRSRIPNVFRIIILIVSVPMFVPVAYFWYLIWPPTTARWESRLFVEWLLGSLLLLFLAVLSYLLIRSWLSICSSMLKR